MRSRPTLTVFLTPEKPRPGDELHVVAKLESRSETPSEGTLFRFEGSESRYSHTTSTGKTSSVHYKHQSIVALEARTDERVLGVGAHQHEARFSIPKDAPPSFQGKLGSIKYKLSVRVSIPWWPDRHEAYEVQVRPPPWRAAPGGPRIYTSHAEGPRAGETYLEATLDPSSGFLGGELVGAVSVSNLKKRAKRLKLALVGVDVAHFESSAQQGEVRRYEWTLVDGKPDEGVRIPFRARLPEAEVPTFNATLFHLEWKLQVVVEASWSADTKLEIPLTLAPEGAPFEGAAALRRLPPVGHERRAKAWSRVADLYGFQNDPESETMTLQVGATAVRVHLEQRPDDGLRSVAYVDWPDLGIGLHVSEGRWTDAFRRRMTTDDAPFDKRFIVRAREPAQLAAFLRGKLRAALLGVAEVVADDAGVTLAAPGGGHRLETLDAFVRAVLEVAKHADRAAQRVPPPRSMKDHLDAWQAFAATTRGRLEIGSMSVEGAAVDGGRFDVRTEWNDENDDPSPLRTILELRLPGEADPSSESGVAALHAARERLTSLVLAEGKLRAALPAPVTDPASLRPTLQLLRGVAAAMTPAGRAGPYR